RDLATTGAIRASLKGLNFQLSKFQLQAPYLAGHSAELLAATRHHLQMLQKHLIAPIAPILRNYRRLIFVPHQVLHYIPFHALFDGERYLVDDYEVSYGASASVLKICRERLPLDTAKPELVLAASDEQTPFIMDEVAALREIMPNAR